VPDAHAALLQSPCLLRVADAHTDLPGRNALEQLVHDGLAELAAGSGDDDHDNLRRLRMVEASTVNR